MTEFTRNCDWVCVHPYVRDRSGLFCVAVKPTIKRQQRSKQKRVKVDNRVVVYTAIPLVILTLLSLVLVFR